MNCLKKTLAAGIAMASILGTQCAHAGDATATLSIAGSMESDSCSLAIQNGGIDYGSYKPIVTKSHQKSLRGAPMYYELGTKSAGMTIDCDTPTAVGVSFTDNRADTGWLPLSTDMPVEDAGADGSDATDPQYSYSLGMGALQ